MQSISSTFLEHLREELARLANPREAETYLRELGTWDCLDELALEFDHSFTFLRRSGALASDLEAILSDLEKALRNLSGRDQFWFGRAASDTPEWQEVRRLARQALQLM